MSSKRHHFPLTSVSATFATSGAPGATVDGDAVGDDADECAHDIQSYINIYLQIWSLELMLFQWQM